MERQVAVVRLADDFDAWIGGEAQTQRAAELVVAVADQEADGSGLAAGAGRWGKAPAPQLWVGGGGWTCLHWSELFVPPGNGTRSHLGTERDARWHVPEWDLVERFVGPRVLA